MKAQNIRLRKTWQLSLPEEFIEQLGIQDDSTLTCFLENNELRIRPEALAPIAPEAYSLSPEKILEIKCFGNMSVSLDKCEISFQSKKAKELTAYLLCRGCGPVKNSVLAETLWPDVPIVNAMDSLYKTIRCLKKICVNETFFPIIILHGETYLERQKISCDLEQFEALYRQKNIPGSWKAAVELYRGTLLETEAYDWITPYEAYYDIRFLEMTEYLADYYEKSGDQKLARYYRLLLRQ